MRIGPAAGIALAGALLAGCTTPAPEQPPVAPAAPTAPAAPFGVPSAADVVARLSPSVVTVRTADGIGSGVVYQPNVVITTST